ncbi:MAG: SPASM domain-containing protein, partial [Clostridiales bacterium]|nr:SPASM domain-containing protein [Clostridiales bacterium]
DRALEYPARDLSFTFQGGEPLLAGLAFFQDFVETARARNGGRARLSFGVQTNGTLVDGDWAAFFAEHRFLVGLSIDGPERIHDRNRRGPGEGSFGRAMRAAEHLARAGAPINALTVVTARSSPDAGRIYRFLTKAGIGHQQYIPCLDPPGAPAGYAPSAAQYGAFLIELFDRWYDDTAAGRPISIRYFDNLIARFAGAPPEMCGMFGRCALQHVVEADGSVYPCDFYCLDEWKLGELSTHSFLDIESGEPARRFVEQSLIPDPACAACEWRALCLGGCRRDRDQGGFIGRNRLCEGYRAFFAHAAPRLSMLARRRRG